MMKAHQSLKKKFHLRWIQKNGKINEQLQTKNFQDVNNDTEQTNNSS